MRGKNETKKSKRSTKGKHFSLRHYNSKKHRCSDRYDAYKLESPPENFLPQTEKARIALGWTKLPVGLKKNMVLRFEMTIIEGKRGRNKWGQPGICVWGRGKLRRCRGGGRGKLGTAQHVATPRPLKEGAYAVPKSLD